MQNSICNHPQVKSFLLNRFKVHGFPLKCELEGVDHLETLNVFQALRKLVASRGKDINALAEANILGAQAFDMSLQSLAELPKPGAIAPGTIENLRHQRSHLNLALLMQEKGMGAVC